MKILKCQGTGKCQNGDILQVFIPQVEQQTTLEKTAHPILTEYTIRDSQNLHFFTDLNNLGLKNILKGSSCIMHVNYTSAYTQKNESCHPKCVLFPCGLFYDEIDIYKQCRLDDRMTEELETIRI
jgi:hypothetical protein